ncbi:YhfG family protein [Porticoccaceae bacterium]|nr:YhfG family protein [Porticoccaceae bacterium]MDB4260342.1 YhfG family protein [Porticoccaceae bacterium]MDB9737210.1 YhfG family protein [Porticoccaceae bacterium]MDB9949639.1 YhfG family protein [Porticoccaceae bacterium]MDC1513969.1 YhfG family protein [Porticoccaceae bacterium]
MYHYEMSPYDKTTSLASKKTFFAKNRAANYRASLRLEGIEPPKANLKSSLTLASVVAHYQALANQTT